MSKPFYVSVAHGRICFCLAAATVNKGSFATVTTNTPTFLIHTSLPVVTRLFHSFTLRLSFPETTMFTSLAVVSLLSAAVFAQSSVFFVPLIWISSSFRSFSRALWFLQISATLAIRFSHLWTATQPLHHVSLLCSKRLRHLLLAAAHQLPPPPIWVPSVLPQPALTQPSAQFSPASPVLVPMR